MTATHPDPPQGRELLDSISILNTPPRGEKEGVRGVRGSENNTIMNSKNKWSVIINAILTALTTILTGLNVI